MVLYTKDEPTTTGLNWSALMVKDGVTVEEPVTKRRGRPPKKRDEQAIELAHRYGSAEPPNSTQQLQSNLPYNQMYNETQAMLKGAIYQIDMVSADIKSQIDEIKGSKTLRGKFKYLSDLAVTQGTLINAKVAAIREMNKTITDVNNLELKRTSVLKLDNQVDDDKHIMDLYNAFIKTPVSMGPAVPSYGGTASSPLGYSASDVTFAGMNMNQVDVGTPGYGSGMTPEEIGYQNYVNNMTPEQRRMQLERDPNIKTVVVYNQETGARNFDVIDLRTGQSVPGVAKPDDFLLENMNINIRTGTARNSDANLDFGLVVIGQRDSINDY